jgi:hypothetical protein
MIYITPNLKLPCPPDAVGRKAGQIEKVQP